MFYIATVTREGKHLLAEFPDAPGCQTFAASEAKLRIAAKEALEGWLEAHLVSGQAPQRPRRRKGFIVPVDPALAVAIELRWARLDAGLSQADLAKRASVSQQQIAKLERPGENPSIATLTRVAAALGLRPDVRFLRDTQFARDVARSDVLYGETVGGAEGSHSGKKKPRTSSVGRAD